MFSGIVEEIGRLVSSSARGTTTRLTFEAGKTLEGTVIGESIAVSGCCLTVVERGEAWWSAEAVAETMRRTSLGSLRAGDPVNLERALRADGRLGGHLVQGHVDIVGTVVEPAPELCVEVPQSTLAYLVEKGSVAVDGVSLTVTGVGDRDRDRGFFRVAIIPHTASVTTLGRARAGDLVNLELDVVAKYVERLLAAGAPSPYRSLPGQQVDPGLQEVPDPHEVPGQQVDQGPRDDQSPHEVPGQQVDQGPRDDQSPHEVPGRRGLQEVPGRRGIHEVPGRRGIHEER